MLLVDNDKTKVRERQQDGRARAYNDLIFGAMRFLETQDLLPNLNTFHVAVTRMINPDLITEILL